jgi:hypothetical protein
VKHAACHFEVLESLAGEAAVGQGRVTAVSWAGLKGALALKPAIQLAEPELDESHHGLAVIEGAELKERSRELRVTLEDERPAEPTSAPVREWLAP